MQDSTQKSYTTVIAVNLEVEGIHRWKDAREKFPEVGFLSDPHRHMFKICAKKLVFHDDRDVEFILFKRSILKYLSDTYLSKDGYRMHDFRSKSCEMIAEELCRKFDLTFCSVYEDGECGAEVSLN